MTDLNQTLSGAPLLETKLFAPRWRAGMVSRARLVERLHLGVRRRLTVVAAPAGFGKTTLLAEWLTERSTEKLDVGWVSLDVSDNDETLFWSYCISAIQRIRPDFGEAALIMLYASQSPAITSVLTTLLNELNTIGNEIVLVLDDYHVIENEAIHKSMVFLLENLPAHIHLVIASRSELSFPVARLRGRGELTELRSSDLRFTPEEAAVFLQQQMGLKLSADDVQTLETRTEGWIAGLQLAALSMQGREHASDFIRSFSGDDRYIADFLVEEVVHQQPASIRDFLLKTSVLERMSGSLCDAVTGQTSGKQTLENLEQSNHFLVPLDNRRQWYRYHHLFGEVLRTHLQHDFPGMATDLHLRASSWYENHGFYTEAIRHALAADDMPRAAELVERGAPEQFAGGGETTLYRWLRMLPGEVPHNRPMLSFWMGWMLLDSGDLEAADKHLQNAERLLEIVTADAGAAEIEAGNIAIVDPSEVNMLPGMLATGRALQSQSAGDGYATIKHARRAIEVLPAEDMLWRGGATAILGLASWLSGELESAYQSFADGLAMVQKTGDIHFQVGGTHILGAIRIAQGRLEDAAGAYRHSMEIANGWDGPVMRGTADLYMGMAEIALERGEPDEAVTYLAQGEALGEDAAVLDNMYRWSLVRARMKEVKGDYSGAFALIEESERRYVRAPLPLAQPFAAMKARIRIAQGRLEDALGWVTEAGISSVDELTYMREYEYLILARVRLLQYQKLQDMPALEEASTLLERLLESTEKGGRRGHLVEVLVLLATIQQIKRMEAKALSFVTRALEIAAPEGFVQLFVDGGQPAQQLLQQAVAEGIGDDFARRVVSVFAAPAPLPGADVLDTPLSARELEILRLIAAGMKNKDIAEQLFISVATVKRHISNVYGKLDVTHRTEAVAKANALGVI